MNNTESPAMNTTVVVDVRAQYSRMDEILSELYKLDVDDAERAKLNEEYDAIVALLVETLGENTHCNKIDFEMWSLFSDLYKDRTGCRPGVNWTYARTKAWLDADAAEYRAEQNG
jgi:hypothetical protein